MKNSFHKIHFLLRLFIFWMLYFALFRLAFIIYHHTKIPDGTHSQTGLSFWFALRLDIATTCVLLFIPYVLWLFQQFYKNRIIHLINLGYTIFVISLVAILNIVNLKMYGELGKLLSVEDFYFMSYFKMILSLISFWSFILLFITCFLLAFFAVKMYRKYIVNFSHPIQNKKIQLFQMLVIPVLLLCGFFYSVKKEKIHYSKIEINNQIATNNLWYLVHSFCNEENTN